MPAAESTRRRSGGFKVDFKEMGLEEARANDEVARRVRTLRTQAGLTQRELANRVGTTASVICRLEDADYHGHSLTMLQRIAAALGHRVEVSFVPATSSPSRAAEEASNPNPARRRTAKKGTKQRNLGNK